MIGKQRILIVDDDENIAELISLYLTKECFDTKIVFNGEDALSTFETYEPNLILLDLMLPGIDGYQVCRRSGQNQACRLLCFRRRKYSTKYSVWNSVRTIIS